MALGLSNLAEAQMKFEGLAKRPTAPLEAPATQGVPMQAVAGNPHKLNHKLPKLFSQPLKQTYVTSGREFYLVFLSVVGSDDPPRTPAPYRRLYISSRARTHVKVFCGGGWSQSVTTDPAGLTTVDLPPYASLGRDETEMTLDQVVHVVSEDVIAVYGFAHNWLSSDGYVALPMESLGKNYVIASLRNALNYYGSVLPGDKNPRSEFAVAAVVDNTHVTFTLSADSYSGRYKRGIPYTVTLNRGQVFQLMARDTGVLSVIPVYTPYLVFDTVLGALVRKIDTSSAMIYTGRVPNVDCDLTSSTVTADQPVAVFSGHERAMAPDSLEFDIKRLTEGHTSRDHIIEQLPPVETWGNHFAVVSSGQDGTGHRPTGGDMVRVLPSDDGTIVKVNGAQVATLVKGTYYQFMAGQMSYVETSLPAMVVKYMQTAIADSAPPGDPDMTVVQPIENMSTFYTIPSIPDDASFSEHHLLLVVDTAAKLSTTYNGYLLQPQTPFRAIPGTRYAWVILNAKSGQQRIESTLPCYAETYGFGIFDSYTIPGGGDFNYTDSLYAIDLDFRIVTIHTNKDSLTHVISAYTQSLLLDTISVYRYTWESGDSNAFTILDSAFSPISLGPGSAIPAHFSFHPSKLGLDSALIRVWSSSRKNVFIKLLGNAVALTSNLIGVVPDTIDFGRVRVGRKRDSLFTITCTGNGPGADIFDTKIQAAVLSTEFGAAPFGKQTLLTSQTYEDSVSFSPTTEGYKSVLASVKNSVPTQQAPNEPFVVLKGRGIQPHLASGNHNFGKIRVGRLSPSAQVLVSNVGTDTTSLVAIEFYKGATPDYSDSNDFRITSDVDFSTSTVKLDTLGGVNAVWQGLSATFTPSTTGPRQAIVRVKGANESKLDTLLGVGVEPYIIATPPLLEFGTITPQKLPSPVSEATLLDTIRNTGSMQGILQKLIFTDKTNLFFFEYPVASSNLVNYTLFENNFIPGICHFYIQQPGEFWDTVRILNDSKNEPIEIAHAKVVVSHAEFDQSGPFDLGVITSCDPIVTTIQIHNPYVNFPLRFDSASLSGSSGGFTRENVAFPIHIPSGGTFPLKVSYQFPADSLNGTQRMVLYLYQYAGDVPDLVDSFVFVLERKAEIFTLSTVAPSFTPSAGDRDPFRLPIYLSGQWTNRKELDNFTLKLKFSNGTFQPIGLDRTGSLTVLKPGDPENMTFSWDEISHTYTIVATNQHISTLPDTTNRLLLTVLARAFVTTDTFATVSPMIDFVDQPCAFRFAKRGDSLFYANECGDEILRSEFLGRNPLLSVEAPRPDPIKAGDGQGLSVPFTAGQALMLKWTLADAGGNVLFTQDAYSVAKGKSSIEIPASLLKVSGTRFLRLEATGTDDPAKHGSLSTKFSITR
jgi:hypothetical protein